MTATEAVAQEHVKIIDRHGFRVVAMSAVALVAGLAVWLFTMIRYDGENTGTMVGILVASLGLIFFFPALQTYLYARRDV